MCVCDITERGKGSGGRKRGEGERTEKVGSEGDGGRV